MQNPGEIAPRECFLSSRTSEHRERRSGTHTPRRKLFESVVDGFVKTTRLCGYGSLLSQGRRRKISDSIFKQPSIVIASEAKQSIVPHKERVDCVVALLLAMTA